jgi:hypothetical protein
MSLQQTKTTGSGSVPVFVNKLEVATGGFSLVNTGLTAGDIIPAGSPVKVSETARTATLSKTAIAQANATNSATDYRVVKGHKLAVGDYFARTEGSKAYAITAITTTETDYDTITIGTTLGAAATAGDVYFESSAEGASAAAVKNLPNALLENDSIVASDEGVSVVIRGTVYERRIPGLITAMKTALKGILFSQSY